MSALFASATAALVLLGISAFLLLRRRLLDGGSLSLSEAMWTDAEDAADFGPWRPEFLPQRPVALQGVALLPAAA